MMPTALSCEKLLNDPTSPETVKHLQK